MDRRERVAPAGPLLPPDEAQGRSLAAVIGELLANLPGLFSDRVDLLSLELQRAGLELVRLLVCGVAAALLLLTAWLGVWAALAVVAVQGGVPWPWVAFGLVLINLLAAWGAIGAARRTVPRLGLPLTRHHLHFGDEALRPETVAAAEAKA